MGTSLVAISKAKAALASARDLHEILQIKDEAKALQAYAKASGEGMDAQNMAAEVRLDAERKAGRVLRVMKKAKPRGSNQHARKGNTSLPVLSDLGITKMQSSRWQQLSHVPDDVFANWVDDVARNRKEELTTRGLELIARQYAKPKKRKRTTDVPIVADKCDVQLIHGDCLEVMNGMAPDSVDLVFGSPPYEDARQYGIEFSLTGTEWVDWMLCRVLAGLRLTDGLVAFVVDGRTRKYSWSATPAMLMARLAERGVCLRKPVIYRRHGTPGSGGPDWFRNDYEFVICCTRTGKLPWSDNTACGTPPKWGNEGSHRVRKQDGTFGNNSYSAPDVVNPGNVIDCLAGGGHTGPSLCHDNEAPFPERLAEVFIRSFCRPGGTVLDPFCGSGTTVCVAHRFGRNAIGIDIRDSQIKLTKRRLRNEQRHMFG